MNQTSSSTRAISVALLAISLMGLLACDSDSDSNATPTPAAEPAAEPAQEPEAMPVMEPTGEPEGEPAMEPDMEPVMEPDVPREPGAEEEAPVTCAFEPSADRAYSATLRWTSYGVPHITADDGGSAAFGLAYAMAKHHICTLADQIVMVRSERAKYFGPGDDDEHIGTDFGFRAMHLREQASCLLRDVSERTRLWVAGFVAGYNHYLEETGVDNLPEACAGAAWVQPVSELDMMSYYQRLNLRASGFVLLDTISSAQPPEVTEKSAKTPKELPDFRNLPFGSNGWALGADKTTNDRGMLLSNTHFPWEGELRWFEHHLTIPGVQNNYGVSLVGVPASLMGFNENVAWTHTVSESSRFTLYNLELVDGDPQSYVYDGEPRRMKKSDYTIEVLQDDGTLLEETRTYYRSHYGPILNIAPFGWNPAMVSTYRDANVDNFGLFDQWLDMARATDLESFQDAHANNNGVPWVNTIMTDRDGNAWYIDSSNVPNLSADGIAAYQQALEDDFLVQTAAERGAVLLQGNDSVYEWVVSDDPFARAVVPYENQPKLLRRDFVLNANDSHWFTHPDELLEGYSFLYGGERLQISSRTQMNAIYLTESGPTASSGEDGRFTLDELEAAYFSNRGFVAHSNRALVAERCEGATEVAFEGEMVDVSAACAILANWDGTMRTESVGAVLWREFISSYFVGSPNEDARFWATSFDLEDPLHTPSGLAEAPEEGPEPVLIGLAYAMGRLEAAGFALDASLGEVQYGMKGDTRFAVHGGFSIEGAINIVSYSESRTANSTLLPRPTAGRSLSPSGLTEEGYLINAGSSFVMAMEFSDQGPVARAITTYSQSADPASEFFADQSVLYGDQVLRPILYTEEEINNDPNLVEETISVE